MRLALRLAVASHLMGLQAFAQTDSVPPNGERRELTATEITKLVHETRVAGGNELTVLNALRELGRRYADFPETSRRVTQLAYLVDAAIGNYEAARRGHLLAHGPPHQPLQRVSEFPRQDLEGRPALEVVASLAGSTQVVMIAEVHHLPEQRVFTAALLPLLWKKGFR